MYRGGPELAGTGAPWPDGKQAHLLRAAVGPSDRARAAFEAWRAATDIDAPVDGGTYRLLPLLYARLTKLGIDDPLNGRLKGVYRRAFYENNRLFGGVAPAIAALEQAGIKTMLLKGAPIALECYASHAMRPMADLDLVVRSSNAEPARRILASLGWMPTSKHPPHELPDLHAQDLRNGDGVEIDLHWHCLRETPSEDVDDWFWSTARPLTLGEVQTLQPAWTPMLLQTILHGVRSNFEPPIRWISDAVALLGAAGEKIDWRQLVSFATKHRVSHRLSLGLRYLSEEFAQPVPAWVLKALEDRGVSFIERVENIVYLGPALRAYSPRLFPLVDYWRYRRVRRAARFWRELPAYLTRRWQLGHPLMIPAAAASAVFRRMQRK